MPPAISDEENSVSEDEIPAAKPTEAESKDDGVADIDSDEDEEGGEGDPDEFVVEKILSHAFDEDGTIRYEVKWFGYEKKSDRTWEPEENLASAQDCLHDYFKKIGGRPTIPDSKAKPKKERKRKLSEAAPSPPPKSNGRGRTRKSNAAEESKADNAKASKKADFPAGSWEDHVMNVDTIEELPDPTTGKTERFAYLNWNNGRKTTHKLVVANQKCPQKMLQYYEQHLIFKSSESDE